MCSLLPCRWGRWRARLQGSCRWGIVPARPPGSAHSAHRETRHTHTHKRQHFSTSTPTSVDLPIDLSTYLYICIFSGPLAGRTLREGVLVGPSGGALQALRQQLFARVLPAFRCQHTHTHTHTSTGWLIYIYIYIYIIYIYYMYMYIYHTHKYTVSTGKLESDSLSNSTECVLLQNVFSLTVSIG
jgi:hypothetical protein